MTHSPRSVVAVSGNPEREDLLDTLAAWGDYDVVFLESIASGYSRIKQVTPDLIFLYFDVDEASACRLLSMLNSDSDLFGIPVVACATGRGHRFTDLVTELIGDASCPSHAMLMN